GDLRPRLDELERSVESQSPAAILVVNYFGFPPAPEDAARFRALRERCLVVEDCVQGSLVELPDAAGGAIGDAVFTSFRKYLPVRLLARLDLADAASRRRANFVALLEALDGSDAVIPLLRTLPPGVSPLALPVRVAGARRDALRAELVRRRIFCPVHWSLPPE